VFIAANERRGLGSLPCLAVVFLASEVGAGKRFIGLREEHFFPNEGNTSVRCLAFVLCVWVADATYDVPNQKFFFYLKKIFYLALSQLPAVHSVDSFFCDVFFRKRASPNLFWVGCRGV
jgi:hypothetical protein